MQVRSGLGWFEMISTTVIYGRWPVNRLRERIAIPILKQEGFIKGTGNELTNPESFC